MIIDVLTATRAEYGLMRPLLYRMAEDDEIEMRLLVSGTHLSQAYGMTIREIENDGFSIYKRIDILSGRDGPEGIAETIGNAVTRFTEHFQADRPDFLLVDGDRYEAFAVCIAAVNCNVPIIHCGGGETTEGATDECYRHSMSKMAYLHFPITDLYCKRVIQMGEDPDRVFSVGSLAIENILNTQLLTKEQLEQSLSFHLDLPYAVVTFHPVTMEAGKAETEVRELLDACKEMTDMKFIFTMANADNGGTGINRILTEFTDTFDRGVCVQSLGSLRYLTALRYCAFVLGNSSSGLLEAPSFHIPTVNIGDRQRGRIKAESVIDCKPEQADILQAMRLARSPQFRESRCKNVINPNGDGHTSEKIIRHIKQYTADNSVDLKKKFYDIEF